MAEAYAYCDIPPDKFWDYTPEELAFMVRISKIKLGIEEPSKPMTNPEMELVAKAISDVYANMPKGVR